jgi:hypothetical protein
MGAVSIGRWRVGGLRVRYFQEWLHRRPVDHSTRAKIAGDASGLPQNILILL